MPFVVTVEGVEGQTEEKIYIRRSMQPAFYGPVGLTRNLLFAKIYNTESGACHLACGVQHHLNGRRKRGEAQHDASLDRKPVYISGTAKVVIEEV